MKTAFELRPAPRLVSQVHVTYFGHHLYPDAIIIDKARAFLIQNRFGAGMKFDNDKGYIFG